MSKIVMFLFSLSLLVMPIKETFAAQKCIVVPGGGLCCWNPDTEGVFPPLSCL